MEKYFSRQQIATMLNVHINTVDNWINKGWLQADKIGGRWRISEEQLNEFMKRNGNHIG